MEKEGGWDQDEVRLGRIGMKRNIDNIDMVFSKHVGICKDRL
jgi:hypothetical protein